MMGRPLAGLRVLCNKQITLVPALDNASVGKNLNPYVLA